MIIKFRSLKDQNLIVSLNSDAIDYITTSEIDKETATIRLSSGYDLIVSGGLGAIILRELESEHRIVNLTSRREKGKDESNLHNRVKGV